MSTVLLTIINGQKQCIVDGEPVFSFCIYHNVGRRYIIIDYASLDLFIEFIKPAGINGTITDGGGPCTGTVGYIYIGMGITVRFNEITNDFSGSYCLGFIVDTYSGNTNPLLLFSDEHGNEIGSLNLSNSSIVYTIRGDSAIFSPVDLLDFQYYQLCSNGSDITLYDKCSSASSRTFSSAGLSETDSISILGSTNEGFGTGFEVINTYDISSSK